MKLDDLLKGHVSSGKFVDARGAVDIASVEQDDEKLPSAAPGLGYMSGPVLTAYAGAAPLEEKTVGSSSADLFKFRLKANLVAVLIIIPIVIFFSVQEGPLKGKVLATMGFKHTDTFPYIALAKGYLKPLVQQENNHKQESHK